MFGMCECVNDCGMWNVVAFVTMYPGNRLTFPVGTQPGLLGNLNHPDDTHTHTNSNNSHSQDYCSQDSGADATGSSGHPSISSSTTSSVSTGYGPMNKANNHMGYLINTNNYLYEQLGMRNWKHSYASASTSSIGSTVIDLPAKIKGNMGMDTVHLQPSNVTDTSASHTSGHACSVRGWNAESIDSAATGLLSLNPNPNPNPNPHAAVIYGPHTLTGNITNIPTKTYTNTAHADHATHIAAAFRNPTLIGDTTSGSIGTSNNSAVTTITSTNPSTSPSTNPSTSPGCSPVISPLPVRPIARKHAADMPEYPVANKRMCNPVM